ncbi:phospholipase A2 [Streptomyces virginiae]|uniref:phospholipase A2 n=2 Tax=Streptomyces TaxID=1883 RepID=UPI003792E5CE
MRTHRPRGGGITDPAAANPLSTDFSNGEITDPQAYRRHCSAATDWLWYLKTNCAAGFNFRTACDMHDYGYGLIGNTYKGYSYYLDRSKKSNVENAFHTTMRTYSCKVYFILRRPGCNNWAYAYYKAVSNQRWGGNPKNGADAT